ncbi:hypothetical protein BAR24066_04440 [Burkholderia arboris]|uniref:Uncharacterized protein n=1 Tax=Burkholderia arboris TaxID=488730 RepID=A0A9Q9SL52_9BURK|nr:hypothetical protein [Burkholderia arboris]VWB93438.1 hypothetical protein BAR24066_04440 [Burkholderia arboris]
MREPIEAGTEGRGAVVRPIAWTRSADGWSGRAPHGDGVVDVAVGDRRAVDAG